MFEGNSPARAGGISVTGSVHSKLALLVRGLALRFADCQGICDALARVAPSNKKKAAHVLIQV